MSRQVFRLPDLGEGLEEAELVRWLVDVGDEVGVDAPIAEVETAKAMVEVPCPYAGIVAELHGAAGDVIPVGSPLVSVEGARTGGLVDHADRPSEPSAAAYVEEERAGSGNVLIGYGTSPDVGHGGARRGRRSVRAGTGAPAAGTVRPHPPTPAPAPLPAPTASAASGPAPREVTGAVAVASPLVRTLARRLGLDLRTVHGTGEGGLIRRADVERAAAEASSTAADPVAPPSPAAGPGGDVGETDSLTGLPVARRIPMTGVRRAIARRMTTSRQEIPEATAWVDVDATGLLELRAGLARATERADAGRDPSGSEHGSGSGHGGARAPGLLALLARFVVAGLARYPDLNARIVRPDGPDGPEEIVHLGGVNLGLAAQTDRGLVVPVVRGAHALRTRELDAEIRRLTAAARAGTATTADLTGGSFTLNNYGVLGTDGSAAIINHPEVAILGVGRIFPRAWVVDGAVVARPVTQLSLVFDHRVCDGGTAGGLLRWVADAVENPGAALMDMTEP